MFSKTFTDSSQGANQKATLDIQTPHSKSRGLIFMISRFPYVIPLQGQFIIALITKENTQYYCNILGKDKKSLETQASIQSLWRHGPLVISTPELSKAGLTDTMLG